MKILKYVLVFLLGGGSVLLYQALGRKLDYEFQPKIQGGIVAKITQKLQSENVSEEGLVFFRGVFLKNDPEKIYAFYCHPKSDANQIIVTSLPWCQTSTYMDGHGKFDNKKYTSAERIKEFPHLFFTNPGALLSDFGENVRRE